MQPATLTRDAARELDRRAIEEFGVPSVVLMENAGRGVADKLCQLGIHGRVIICCGSGNNGGDGFVVARHLNLRGFEVEVLLTSESQQPLSNKPSDAAINLEIIRRSQIPIELLTTVDDLSDRLRNATWIVDALLGTGARGEPRPPLDAVIDNINACRVPILAVDLPSGLDADTGEAARHTIRAAHTCTFVAPKRGFYADRAETFTGQVHVLDIGAPRMLVEQILKRSNR
jgi:NAD(P)H-hydrate epimerase